METVSFDIDASSLVAAQKWREHTGDTSSSSGTFKTTFNAIRKAIGEEERDFLSNFAEGQDDFDDEEDFMYVDESRMNAEGRSNGGNEQQDRQQEQPQQQEQLRQADHGVQWFNLGLIVRIIFGSFLLTNSFSSYSYRIGLGILSCLYYLLETGLAAYLMKKYLNFVSSSSYSLLKHDLAFISI